MKTTLYMAMSLNGYIADEEDNEDFLSDECWDLFVKESKEVGCFIVGRKTYDKYTNSKEYNFDKVKAKKIIVSKSKKDSYGDYYFVQSPKSAISKASALGFNNVLVVGGSKLSSTLVKEKLINEIKLNIEPAILGAGLKLFSDEDFFFKLKLIKIEKKWKDIVQLRYKILK